MECCRQVQRQNFIPALIGEGLDWGDMLNTRIVDQNINPPEPLTRELRKSVHLVRSSQIGGAIGNINAPGSGNLVCEALAFATRSTAVQNQVTACLRKSAGDPLTDAPRRPGDHSRAAGERPKDCI